MELIKGKPPFRGKHFRFLHPVRPRFFLIMFFVIPLLLPYWAFADWSSLMNRLVDEGFNEEEIRNLFSRPEVRFEPGPMSSKLVEILKRDGRVPSDRSRAVYRALLKSKMITRARAYMRENHGLLEKVSSQFCVPKEIIVSILLVETRLGDFLGERWAFNSLASMALCAELEMIRPYLPEKLVNRDNEGLARTLCRQKAEWAYGELKALLIYSGVSGFDPIVLPSSIYGAIGLCQFMPSSALFYGVDADQDGRIDLFSKSDAIYSIANYLREHGWGCAMDKSSQKRVIFDYNQSRIYVNTVLAVAERLKGKTRSKN